MHFYIFTVKNDWDLYSLDLYKNNFRKKDLLVSQITFYICFLVKKAQETAKWIKKRVKKEGVPINILYSRKKYKKFRRKYNKIASQSSREYIPSFRNFVLWIYRNEYAKDTDTLKIYEKFKKEKGIAWLWKRKGNEKCSRKKAQK